MAINDKQREFIHQYVNNGHNVTMAYRKAYSECKTDTSARKAGSRLLTSVDVKAEITRQLSKKHKTLDLSRNAQHDRLMAVIDDITTPKSVKVSALRELNDMLGYHRDKAPNAEREQAIRQKMTDEELVLHQEIARLRTQQESIRLVQDKKHA